MPDKDKPVSAQEAVELKPCPFCGGESRLKDNEVNNLVYDPESLAVVDCDMNEADTYWVECIECGAIPFLCGSEDEAATLWNRRPDIKEAPHA